MILSKMSDTVYNASLHIELEDDNYIEDITERTNKCISDVTSLIKSYMIEVLTKGKENTNPLLYSRSIIENIDTYFNAIDISRGALNRFARTKLRHVYNNPIIDSFKSIMNKDLSKYNEDLLNKEFTLNPGRIVHTGLFNILTQLNPEITFQRLKDVSSSDELTMYYADLLRVNHESIESCSLRQASIFYSRILTFKDEIDYISNVFNQLIAKCKEMIEDCFFKMEDPINGLKLFSTVFSSTLLFIINAITLLKIDIQTYIDIIEEVVIQVEKEIYKLDEEQSAIVPEKKYKKPIW